MSVCRYNISKECNSPRLVDCVECTLIQIRQEIVEIPTHIKDIGYYQQREIHSYKGDVLEIIDKHITEREGEDGTV